MTKSILLLVCCWSTALLAPPLNFQGPQLDEVTYIRSKIYEIHPKINSKRANKIARLIFNNCSRSDWIDAVRIAWLESSFRFRPIPETPDIGLMQISPKWHPHVVNFTTEQRIAYACKLIKQAKKEGNLAFYHSKSSPFKERYEKRLSGVLNERR